MARGASRGLVVLAFVAFVSLGLPDTLLGVAWPSMRATFDVPISGLGQLLFPATVGYLIASFSSGRLVGRLGVGGLLAGSCALVCVALATFALSPAWAGLLMAALMGGVGAGAIDAGVNAFGARRFSPRVLNWLHASWGIGATVGPLVMTAAIARFGSWRGGYAVLAAVMLALTALFFATRRRWRVDPGEAHGDRGGPAATFAEALRSPVVIGQALFFFAYGCVEGSAGAWGFSLLTDARGLPVAAAGSTVAAYWASITLGRIGFGQLAASVRPATILSIGLIGAAAGTAFVFVPVAAVTTAGFVLLGASLAPLYPTMMSVTPVRVGERLAAHAVGFQVSACALGIAVGPSTFGLIARRAGVDLLPAALTIGMTALVALDVALAARRRVPAVPSAA